MGVSELKKFVLNYASTTLYFGPGAISNLEGELEGYESILIATGKRSAKLSGALDDLLSVLKKLGIGYEVFSDVTPNPWASQADRMAQHAWSMGADAILAVGGGSVIDTAKVAAMIVVGGGKAKEYVYGERKGRGCIPVYAVNITHGTGTEVDRYSVLTVEETGEKRGIISIYPVVSVDDPKYTLTLPKDQSIYVSLDAFYHAYEAATQPWASPFVELLASETIRLVRDWLPRAVEKPGDLEPRYWLLYASMLAGIAIDLAGTHIVHLIEHALSGMKPELAHGCGLAIAGPRSAYYIHRHAPEVSAKLLGILDQSIRPTVGDAEKAENAVKRFQESIGFEQSLQQYGFTEEDLTSIAERGKWPLGLSSSEVLDILKRAF
ncbi:MAG: iron-containing alcohol dehydrogenase [Thermofilaceae archaeon]